VVYALVCFAFSFFILFTKVEGGSISSSAASHFGFARFRINEKEKSSFEKRRRARNLEEEEEEGWLHQECVSLITTR
jgi:hypothetical protein